jgi:hypothetical protein
MVDMRWRAVVVVRFSFREPKTAACLEHELTQSLTRQAVKANVLNVDPPGNPQFVFLRVSGCSARLCHAGAELALLVARVGRDLDATTAEVVMWSAHRRGPRGLVAKASGGRVTGRAGNGGPGTAGVREPRRPFPGGPPPMRAALDLPRT